MPPQQTKLTSETGRDPAGLSLGIASVKNATSGALAEAYPNAAAAALRDGSSAAGPPVASTRNVPGLLERYWRAFRKWRQRERLRVSLQDLSERELVDIGLTSGEIDYIVVSRAVERLRDGMRYL